LYQWSKEDQQYQLLPTTTATATQPAGAALADQSADEHLAHEPAEHRGHSPHDRTRRERRASNATAAAAAAAASGSVKSGRPHFPDHSAADGGCQPAESADCPIESADSTVYQ